ncbi:efflux RND transporter permease subunit [Halomicrobium salinisoli]|uniref:efflux RND transporter permease subunit n=1 Tax=Halomicrobium salinisoli TaxID=2878391 RepID=UPI001CF02B40|nr:MMPL family transporter [Halomicrobium salinisoli]
MEYQRYVDWVDDRIVHDSRRVILAFLVLTLVFAGGLGATSTEAGTQQFAQGIPENEALESINDEFSPTFTTDTGSTQLLQSGTNVLSRDAMLRMLRTQERLDDNEELRVTSTGSAAAVVAQRIDPEATTIEQQIDAIEHSTRTERKEAIRAAYDENPQFQSLVGVDFNRQSASTSATLGTVTHEVPEGLSGGAGQGGGSPLAPVQERADFTVQRGGGGSIETFGSAMIGTESQNLIMDSLLLVVPAAVILILTFLLFAYRDLADLVLGVVSLVMAIVWTFGFTGYAGIPFSIMLVAVPPMLLAVGIDFGIHSINRYREERVKGASVEGAMRITTDQLLVAFFIVAGTTVIGFLSNYASPLGPIQEFGLTAAAGIVFTFLIFGVFLPAAKVELDRLGERYPIPQFSQSPLGSEGSALGSVLRTGVVIADRAPALFLVGIVVLTASAGAYGAGVDTSFEDEDFLPPEDIPVYLEELPEPFAPSEYETREQLNFLEDNFESTQSSSATVYVEGHLTRDDALEEIYRAGDSPPDTFVEEDGRAEATSIVTIIRSQAERDPEFERMVDRNDRNDNGVPDDNLREIYDYLLDSSAGDRASDYITEDYRSTRVVYTVESDAGQGEVYDDTWSVAEDMRMTATATGALVVFAVIEDLIFESAVVSLAVALGATALFLVVIYRLLEGYATLGVANVFAVVVTVAMIPATMRLLNIPFNAITAMLLAITIGLGVDYSVHVTHRFADERAEHDLMTALDRTVRGTGGALFGSMLTTTAGLGVLAIAISVPLQQFGILTAISVALAFLSSLLVLPPTLVVWDALIHGDRSFASLFGVGRQRPAAANGAGYEGADTDQSPGLDEVRPADVGELGGTNDESADAATDDEPDGDDAGLDDEPDSRE